MSRSPSRKLFQPHRIIAAGLCAATFVGCGGKSETSLRVDPATLVVKAEAVAAQAATRFDGSTLSADGTSIAFTVYAPSIAVGNSAPLVITGPGWGNTRLTNLDTAPLDTLELVQQGAKVALEEGPQGGPATTRGWYVIAFDQRGFGQSGGVANVQDPNIESKDVSAIISWAEKNLPRLAFRKAPDGTLDPVVGGIGGSYGGGFQTIGAGVDKRIDAIVPAVTWYNLATSLFEKPKSMWTALLFTPKTTPAMQQALTDGFMVGKVNESFLTEIYQHSPASYCEGKSTRMSQPTIPGFYIQGTGDTLFPLNEGVSNYECNRKANSNSKFLAIRGWHYYDGAVSTAPKANLGGNISCNGAALNLARLQFSFLAQNLVDSRLDASASSRYSTLPDVRTVLDDGKTFKATGESTEGACFEMTAASANPAGQVFTRGGTAFTAQIGEVTAGLPVSLSALITAAPLALITSPEFAALLQVDAAKVVELMPATSVKRTIVGIPTASLTVAAATARDNSLNAPIIYVGLARIRADGTRELLHDQVVPVEGFGKKTITLGGLSTLLLPGERIGAVVYGFHPQYYQVYSRVPVNVTVTDLTVNLPVVQ